MGDEERLRLWVDFVGRKDWTPVPSSKICGLHFEEQCFIQKRSGKFLRPRAVPTISAHRDDGARSQVGTEEVSDPVDPHDDHIYFVNAAVVSDNPKSDSLASADHGNCDTPQGLEEEMRPESDPTGSAADADIATAQGLEDAIAPERDPPGSASADFDSDSADESVHAGLLYGEHSYSVFLSPRTMKRLWVGTESRLEVSEKKRKVEKQRTRRLRAKLTTLSDVFQKLQQEMLISTKCAERMEATYSGLTNEIIGRLKQGKRSKVSKDLKSFAMTLHFYSPKAYDYVRHCFEDALPHPDTIRTWYTSISADPGFTGPSFSTVEAHVKARKEEGKETLCALMMDEMAIKKHVEYAGDKFYGYVDHGTGEVDDSLPPAKDALVFMAVAIDQAWKIPLGYFLVDGLTGEERANIVTECLLRLRKIGVRTVSLTCDGPSCHFAMLRALGADLRNVHDLRTSFIHPADKDKQGDEEKQQVHVILDVCHMLKLLRNALAQFGELQSPTGKIKWQYIEELIKLQNEEGLTLGNKLKMRHLNWESQKMKVKLAAQVISKSVADALVCCNETLKLPQFKGCEATVEFLRTFDAAFDVLNSRNPLGKGSKAPMKTSNKESTVEILLKAEKALLELKDDKGKELHSGRRKTCVIGFMASCKSVRKIFEELVEQPNSPCRYLLTYKLSQDHLEIFFSAIRGRGGFNNNPTARQFTAAYKRLLVKQQVKIGTGNCQPQDDTEILEVTTATVNTRRRLDLEPVEPELDHDYFPSADVISQFKEEAIAYIAGFVVKKMKEKHNCFTCIEALTSSTTVHPLVLLKDRGGLQKASDGVVAVCLETERCFQALLKDGKLPQGRGVTDSIVQRVLRRSARETWFSELSQHMFETTIEDNHVHQLVRMASSIYCKIKMHHLARRETETIQKAPVRQKLNKLVLHLHQ